MTEDIPIQSINKTLNRQAYKTLGSVVVGRFVSHHLPHSEGGAFAPRGRGGNLTERPVRSCGPGALGNLVLRAFPLHAPFEPLTLLDPRGPAPLTSTPMARRDWTP